MSIGFSECVKSIILDPIEVHNAELMVFKIDIFKHCHKGYFATLWRLDMYNISPTFPTQEGWIASESFFIDDSFQYDGLGLLGNAHYFTTLDECQNYVIENIAKHFNL